MKKVLIFAALLLSLAVSTPSVVTAQNPGCIPGQNCGK